MSASGSQGLAGGAKKLVFSTTFQCLFNQARYLKNRMIGIDHPLHTSP
jgi:hypothetical protein